MWAFRHTERNIAETGLNLLLEMLKNFQVWFVRHLGFSIGLILYIFVLILYFLQNSEFCNQFYRSYFVLIVQEIFAVLTDTFHKPGFKLHVLVLQHLFCLVCYMWPCISCLYLFKVYYVEVVITIHLLINGYDMFPMFQAGKSEILAKSGNILKHVLICILNA